MAVAGAIRSARPAGQRAGRPFAAAAALVAGTALAVALAGVRAAPGGDRPGQFALLAVLLGTALAARRVPLVAGGCCLAAYAAYGGWGYDAAAGVELPLVLALFLVGLHGGPRALWWLAVPTALVGGVRGAGMAAGPAAEQLTTAVVLAFLCSVPLWIGVVVGRLREDARRQRGRAERAARLADLERAAGVAQERARIARELHDIVAHRLSAIAVQAHAGGHLAHRDPGAAARTFDAVAEQATHGLAEMHGLLGVLRDPGTPAAPGGRPGLADLPDLLAAERSTGAQVTGPAGPCPAVTLDPDAELAAYRVVQESLSNARRHAAGAPVSVRLTAHGPGLEVAVGNGPAGPGRDAGVGVGGGFGLLGMRERVELCGGTLEAGPAPGGGWRVRAVLPARTDRPGRARAGRGERS